MYGEEQATGKFHTWAVWSYVFAAVSALGTVGSVIEWIFWKKGMMKVVSNAIWRMAHTNSTAKFHIIMAAIVLVFAVGVFTNIFGSRLLKREEKTGTGSYIFTAILDAIGGIAWAIAAVFALTDGIGAYDKSYQWIAIGTGAFGILTLAAMMVSTVFLFQKSRNQDNEPVSLGQAGSNLFMTPPMEGVAPFDPMGGGQPPMGQPPMGQPPMGPPSQAPGFGPSATEMFQPETPRAVSPQPPMGTIRVTRGNVVGQSGYQFPESNKIVVGKNPQSCTLVVSNPHISNTHCSVRYNAGRNTYIVRDHSMNGTYVNNTRLPQGAAMECPAGTVLFLASADTQVTLG